MKTDTAVKRQTHTPTPWTIHIGAKRTKDHWEPITIMGKTAEGLRWGVAQINVADDRDVDMQSANAAFIVRAVNAHEDLLDVLHGLKAAIVLHDLDENAAILAIEKAIAKAEGR